jgi:Copper chaperone PCu(A)C
MRSFDWISAGLAVALAQISTTPVQAADYDISSIHITEPWARATPKGASSGAAYMTIRNNGTTPDRVSCVSTVASAQCQIYTMPYPIAAIGAAAPGTPASGGGMKMEGHGGMMQMDKHD